MAYWPNSVGPPNRWSVTGSIWHAYHTYSLCKSAAEVIKKSCLNLIRQTWKWNISHFPLFLFCLPLMSSKMCRRSIYEVLPGLLWDDQNCASQELIWCLLKCVQLEKINKIPSNVYLLLVRASPCPNAVFSKRFGFYTEPAGTFSMVFTGVTQVRTDLCQPLLTCYLDES